MIRGRMVQLAPVQKQPPTHVNSAMVSRVSYQIQLKTTAEMIGELYYIQDSAIDLRAEIVIQIWPFYQGRGLGEDALYHLVDHLLLKQGYHQVCLFVSEGNQRAQKLYRRLGFEPARLILQGGYDAERDEVVAVVEMELSSGKWSTWRDDYSFNKMDNL